MEKKYFDLLMSNTEPVEREAFGEFHENPIWSSNVVDVHMGNLRRKLRGLFEIEAVRGAGYIIRKA